MAEKKKIPRYSHEFHERAARLLDEHQSDYRNKYDRKQPFVAYTLMTVTAPL